MCRTAYVVYLDRDGVSRRRARAGGFGRQAALFFAVLDWPRLQMRRFRRPNLLLAALVAAARETR